MKPVDYVKAVGLGLLILVLDLAAAFVAVWLYSLFVEPGHPQAFYVAAAPAISTASTRIVGPLLFAVLVWWFSRRRPGRNPFIFAVVTFAAYLLIDGGLVAYKGFFVPAVILILGLKLLGALAGAALAWRTSRPR